MFIPNNTCFMRRKGVGFDKYGQPSFGNKQKIKYALVRYDTVTEDSTVRADSSATRGNIKEYHASGRILVPINVVPDFGDLFIIEGKVFRAKKVEPRYNVLGRLDHYQIDYEKTDDAYGDET